MMRDVLESDVEKMVGFFSEEVAQPNILSEHRNSDYVRRMVNRVAHYLKTIPYSDRNHLSYAVIEKNSGALIGTCSISLRSGKNAAKLGWHFSSSFSSRGYATESAVKLLEVGFNRWNIDSVYADCFGKNIASIRVFEKSGLSLKTDISFWRLKSALYYLKLSPVVRYEIKRPLFAGFPQPN